MDGIVLQDVSASKMYFEIWKYILENLATGNTLTIKIKSKNDKEWITTSNPSIIRALFHKKYRVPLNEIGGNDISKTSPDKKEFTVTLFKLTFTRLLERLFEQLESVRKQRRKNAGISNMENLLIIALIQFTGIDTIKHKDEVHSLRLTRLKYNDFIFFHPSFNFL